jgi:hypothetical protein
MLEMYSASALEAARQAKTGRRLIAATAVALLATAALLSACARKPQGSAQSAAAPTEAGSAGADAQAEAAPAAQAGASQRAGPAPQAPAGSAKDASELKRDEHQKPELIRGAGRPGLRTSAPTAAATRGFGLGVASVPRMPEDFSLGPLQSYRPAEGDEAAVFAVARKFMDGIEAGRLDDQLLLPEAREALSVLLAPSGQEDAPAQDAAKGGQAASPYRLGAVDIRGDDASLMVRMPRRAGEASRVEGMLSLSRSGGAWFVQALALEPPETGALAFAPGARRSDSDAARTNDGD